MDDLLWQHLKTLPAFRALLRAVEARFYHQFEIPGPVLDIGCGDGDFANHTFNEFGRNIDVGFDPWLRPLKKSVRYGIYQDGALQADGAQMPFPSNHFGAVFSNSVLEHIPEVADVLIEAGRVLQPGGIFIMTMPNHRFTKMLWGAQLFERWGMQGMADRYRTFFNFISRHQHTEPVEWWADELAKGGMAVERWQYYFSPAALHTLEFGHVQGLPSAITNAFTGKWVIAPIKESLGVTDRWVRSYFLEQADDDGCYQFILARKVNHGPIQTPELPPSQPFEVLPNGDLKSDLIESPVQNLDIVPAELSEDDWATEVFPTPEQELEAAESAGFSLPSVPAIAGVLGGFLLSFIAIFLTDGRGTDRPWAGIFFWMLSVGSATVSLAWSNTSAEKIFDWLRPKLTPKKLLIPAGLFAVAWLIRGWNLTGHPWIISGTEAGIGIEKLIVLAGFAQNPFGTDGITNPLLPYFLTSFTESLFGPSVFALRMLSPLVGAATVVLVYAVGKRFWGDVAGLSGAVLLLGNHTHIHYSRIGLTNIWDPFWMLASAALLVLAWQNPGRMRWLAAGLITGISGYFFTAGHLLPAVLPLLFVTLIFTEELQQVRQPSADSRPLGQTFRGVLAAVLLTIITSLPLLAHYLRVPGRFMDRLVRQGVIQTGWIEAQGSGAWFGQILDSLSILSLSGAPDLSTYYGSEIGLTTILPTLFFIGGFILLVLQARRGENQMLLWLLVVSVFGAGVLLIDPPQSHRYLVLLPVISLIGGIALQWVTAFMQDRLKLDYRWLLVAAVALSAISVLPDLRYYFGAWQDGHTFTDRNTEIAFEITEVLNQLPADATVYLQTEPILNATFPTIGYLAPRFERGSNLVDLPILNGTVPQLAAQGPTVFVILPERASELTLLQNSFPAGETTVIPGFFADPLFTVYTVDG